jgi:hypothetical protein
MHTEKLDETNFMLYAAKYYDNPSCFDTLEFYEDLNRFKYIKLLFSRYEETGELKERLILNHIIILYNLFGVQATTRLLFFKLKGYYHCLVPFLLLLNYLPDKVQGIGLDNKTISTSDIILDPGVVNMLRKITDGE